MKKQQINFSWPASLSNFSKDSVQENFSRGKLKVFYKGETADRRFFSDDFSEKLIETLPYTPVVSYYDEEKEDFVGHATEQQIFGIVDPCVAPVFETDDKGVNWCVCDVVLYTERPDKVGDLAAKIIDHPQSLELDPNTVKYIVNYDEKKHFKNIEFTDGSFVGVSVLGKDQKPAFTDSAFFSYDEKLEEKMQLLKNYCENKSGQTTQHGGEKMNLKEFMQLSWGDISCKVDEAIGNAYANDAYTYVVDMFADSAIVKFYYYIEGTCKLMRVNYTADENGAITLGNVNEVYIKYEDIPQSQPNQEVNDMKQVETPTDAVENAACGEPENKGNASIESEKDKEEEPGNPEEEPPKDDDKTGKEGNCESEEDGKEENKPTDDDNKGDEKNDDSAASGDEGNCEQTEFSTGTAQVSNVVENQETTKASVENEQNNQETASTASFTESERAELETLRREKKLALVDSYKDSLSEDDYAKFTAMVDSVDEEKLELELLRAYKASESSRENSKPMRVFSACTPNNTAEENSFESWIAKNLKRR